MKDVAKRVAGFALLVIAGIILVKLVIGAVVGFVKFVLILGLLAVFAFVALAVLRR